jgi:hypothetical protein
MRGDSLQRIGIKLFLEQPAAAGVREFVPVFHSWIQKQCLEGHLLIDVHDYSHVHHGPGILLVAHEANLGMDMAGGRAGLLYTRKQPLPGSTAERVKASLAHALQACALLEDDPAFAGKLRFRTDELQFLSNDRLLAPNDSRAFDGLQRDLAAALEPVLGKVSMMPAGRNPKDRLAVAIRIAPVDFKQVLKALRS